MLFLVQIRLFILFYTNIFMQHLLFQNAVTEVYSALVNKMCTIINSLASYNIEEYDPQVTCDDLLYFAAESMEEGAIEKAQEYLLQVQ